MKKLAYSLIISFILFSGVLFAANAAPITPISGGGTQTSTAPQNGYLLIGNASNTYSFISSSSLTGAGSITNVFAGNGISVAQVGTNATVTNTGVLSNAGDWAGTWQGQNSTTFYLASNPSGYISSYTTTTPASPNSTFQFDNSGLFGSATEMTYSTTTGQTRFTAQANNNYGNSISVGGVVNITNTQSTSTDFVINDSVTNRTGRGVVFNFSGASGAQDGFVVLNNSTGSTAMDIQCWAAGKGCGKYEHNQPADGSSDANASALSVALNGTSTAAQGLFIDSASGTTGNLLEIRNAGNTKFRLSSAGVPTFAGITSSLMLLSSAGLGSAYGGSTNPCLANQAPTTLSALGALGGCTATFLTAAITSINGDSTAAYTVTSSLPISLSTSSGKTTIGLNIGSYLGTSGANLTVSSTLASSSLAFNFYTPTTTAGYNVAYSITPNQKTIQYVDCADQAGTSTISLYYATSSANAAAGAAKIASTTLASLSCGVAGNSTTTFNQAVLPIGDYLMAVVTSTVGSVTHVTVNITAIKQ